MKIKQIIIAGTLLVSVATFAQKDELKALKKIYNKDVPSANDLADYKANLSKLETLATQEEDKVYFNYYKCILPEMEIASLGTQPTPLQVMKLFTPKNISEIAKGYSATLEYEKKTGKKVFTDDINEEIEATKPMLLNVLNSLQSAKKYKEVSEIFYSIYLLDKKETKKLYNASEYAIEAKEWDKALEYLKELKAINYLGEGTDYFATNKETKVEDYFEDKAQRDLFIKAGTHDKPREVKVSSKKGDIVKNIALILVQENRTDEAKAALADARKLNPDDTNLILTEADICYKLNDIEGYKKLINEALVKNPNDAELLFNLGIVSGNANQYNEAEKYYTKAIQIKPDYVAAYLNLADIKLKPDTNFVEEMNKLGTTDKDLKRYAVLKADRQKLFNEVMPILEKAYELSPDNDSVKQSLMTVYKFLELNDTDKYKALKAKM